MNDIKQLTQHRWLDIHKAFGVDEHILTGKHMACPLFCDGGKDRFRYTDHAGGGGYFCSQCGHGDGFELLGHITGKTFKELANEIREMLGGTTARPSQTGDVAKNRAKLKKLWSEANPLSKGCPTHRYLFSRSIVVPFADLAGLRCHPGVDYWDSSGDKPIKVGRFPAMLGLVTLPSGEPATIHITYLTKDGAKAEVDRVRKLMPTTRPMNSGVVRLESLKPNQDLLVAEGIETALSLKTLHPEVCAWACISAGNMENFVAPGDASTIYIGADNDESFTGQAAAFSLAKKLRLKKFEVRVLMPAMMGTDWNDELVNLNDKAVA